MLNIEEYNLIFSSTAVTKVTINNIIVENRDGSLVPANVLLKKLLYVKELS